MGLYDREYGRHPEPGWHLQAPQSITTKLVLFTACMYGLQLAVKGFTGWFVLPDTWYLQPWNAYRLLSYGFLHSPQNLWHLLVNMLVLWMFGRELEAKYGGREFLWLYLWAIFFAGLIWAAIEAGTDRPAVLLGASGGVSAIVALFALNFPQRRILFMFFIPMPMWVAAVIAILVDISYAMDHAGNIAGSAHLAGAICGLYYYKTALSPGRWLADRLPQLSPQILRARPKLRIHEPTENNSQLDREVDAILAKIQAQGQDSLTARERKMLEKASRQYQDRRNQDGS